MMKQVEAGKEDKDNKVVLSVSYISCLAEHPECVEYKEIVTELYPEQATVIIQDNIWISNERDKELNIVKVSKISMRKKKTKEVSCIKQNVKVVQMRLNFQKRRTRG